MMTLEEFARRAIGVPFVGRGRDYSGWDCWALVYLFHRDVLGVAIPSYAENYDDTGDTPKSRKALNDLSASNIYAGRRVSAPEPGDVVLLNIGGRTVHVGIVIGDDRMLHTASKVDTRIARLSSPMWERRIEGYYRAR